MAFYFTPTHSYLTEIRKITVFYAEILHITELSSPILYFNSYLKG